MAEKSPPKIIDCSIVFEMILLRVLINNPSLLYAGFGDTVTILKNIVNDVNPKRK